MQHSLLPGTDSTAVIKFLILGRHAKVRIPIEYLTSEPEKVGISSYRVQLVALRVAHFYAGKRDDSKFSQIRVTPDYQHPRHSSDRAAYLGN
jgi:hypothetical protein